MIAETIPIPQPSVSPTVSPHIPVTVVQFTTPDNAHFIFVRNCAATHRPIERRSRALGCFGHPGREAPFLNNRKLCDRNDSVKSHRCFLEKENKKPNTSLIWMHV
jgi:hypothetical protein